MKQTKLWDAAIHEAAHLVVYVKAGGTASGVVKVRISDNGTGAIFTPYIIQLREPTVADAAITAAGIACEQIRGLETYEGRGGDTDNLHDILWNDAEELLVIAKTRHWLETKWHHVEWTAERLVAAVKRKEVVPHRAVREIVNELTSRLKPTKAVCSTSSN
jgi:hypothetical protein